MPAGNCKLDSVNVPEHGTSMHTPPVQAEPGAHVTGFAPVHVPAWQVSVCVQALPSVHAKPLAWLDHVVVDNAGLHTWHGFAGFGVFGG